MIETHRIHSGTARLWLNFAVFCLPLCAVSAQIVAAQPPQPAQRTINRPARIEMEISLEAGLPPTASHDWHKTLTDLKVDGVRIRSSRPTDKPEITSVGSPSALSYKVVGRLSGSNALTLPGGRFQMSDKAGLTAWLTRLRQEGPARAAGAPRLPFGLTKEQFGMATKDLSTPIGFSTVGLKPADFVHQLADVLAYPVTGDNVSAQALKLSPPLDVELRGMTAGTAAAYVLDVAGLALAPRVDATKPIAYALIPADSKQQRWPIGLPPQRPKPELAPALFETIEVELDDVELSRVLESVGEAIHIPILVDRRSLAKAQIDLTKTRVSLPARRLVYASVLDRALGAKFLENELRIDDAGQPFLLIRAASGAAPPAPKAKSAKPAAKRASDVPEKAP